MAVMTAKFFDLQFKFNSSVIHIDMMIACNAQHSQENPNGQERGPQRDRHEYAQEVYGTSL